MKNRKIAALVMAAALATSLVGCGERSGIANDNDILGDENGYTAQQPGGGSQNGSNGGTQNGGNGGVLNGSNNGSGGSGGTTGSGTEGGTSGMNGGTNGQSRMYGGAANFGTNNPANGMATHTATWQQMLENGRVHDRDGYLLDGENSCW